jgi:hypothetical protein
MNDANQDVPAMYAALANLPLFVYAVLLRLSSLAFAHFASSVSFAEEPYWWGEVNCAYILIWLINTAYYTGSAKVRNRKHGTSNDDIGVSDRYLLLRCKMKLDHD